MRESRITGELVSLLGEADFLRLVEHYAGTRLYVPANSSGTDLATRVGAKAAASMVRRYSGDTIVVPLARDLRARHYKAAGHSNAEIARRLGITENGVAKLFSRMPDRPEKGRKLAQPDLFD